MTLSQWKSLMEELVDGIEQELGSTVAVKTKVALDTFRNRLDKILVARERKPFEQELEAFLQSKRTLRAAGERYMRKYIREKIHPALEALGAAIKRVRPLLGKNKMKRSTSKATK